MSVIVGGLKNAVPQSEERMKAYLIVTGLLFALLGGAHVVLTVTHWDRWPDPAFVFQGPGIGAIAMGLALWAGRLLLGASSSEKPTGTA